MIVDALFVVLVAATTTTNPTEVESAAYSFQTRHQCETFRSLALAELMKNMGGKYRFYISDCVASTVEEVRPQ